MTYDEIETAAAFHGLMIMGASARRDGNGTRILLGAGHGFWPIFQSAPEFSDGAADPLDRWSRRVIDAIAHAHGGSAVYPSDGPPYAPFIDWAMQTGRFWQSPVGMMVHDTVGLMISIRGALHLSSDVALPGNPGPAPCASCPEQPCLQACPVDALSRSKGYDVARCRLYLDTRDGADCMSNGCKARRACPVSERFGRPAEQSAFHMRAFHPQ
ncbi:MAG: ferredoxin [Pseudomonadota bacterium]